MSEEMKLIEALCKALGFKVEREIDSDIRRIPVGAAELGRSRIIMAKPGFPLMKDVDENGMCKTMLVNPIVSYKVVPIEK